MALPASRLGPFALAAASALALSGCGLGNLHPAPADVQVTLAGAVHGGQQPVLGATIQVYAASPLVAKGASTALLTGSPVTTLANGTFSLSGHLSCPSSSALVYLVATGGNPGLPAPGSGTVNNAQLAEMAVLGPCSSITSGTFIQVNELTTVAAVEALAPFMADYAHIGNDASNPIGLAGAFATASALVSATTGQIVAGAANQTQPIALLDTLADILSACVNTSGGTANDGSACGTLLGNAGTGTASDTIGAALAMVTSPAANVPTLFGLVNSQSPFQPALTTAPGDLSLSISTLLPTNAFAAQFRLLAVDTAQHVWVYTPNQTSSSTWATGTITLYDNNGNILNTVQPGAGGLSLPVQLAADPSGNMWALNNNATVSKFDPTGNALSPTGGFPVPFNVSSSPIYTSTSYPHELGLNYMAIDPSGNVWGIGSGTSSGCFIELNPQGTVITPSGNFCASAANQFTAAVTTDALGDAWLVGTGSVARINPSGALVNTGVNTNGCFTDNLATAQTVEDSVQNLFWDRTNNQIWGVGDVTVGALTSSGAQVFCNPAGANLPVTPVYSTGSAQSGNATSGYNYISAAALDGAGNLWFVTAGTLTTEASFNVSAATVGGLNAISPAGALLTPYNAPQGVYGLQSATAQLVNEKGNLSQELAVDAYGNLWYVSGNNTLVKVPGLASPKNHQ